MDDSVFEIFASAGVADTSAPMLEVANIARHFAATPAVKDVSLTVRPGEVTCLLGASGCGKSTTLRMIAGIERLDAGSIRIEGQPVADHKNSLPPERRSVGMVFQDLALFPHMTVAENITFGIPRARRNGDQLEQMLRRIGLSGYGGKYPHQLSGGEQQRVALARALATQPRVMLLDEPFSSLDQRLRAEMREFSLDLLRATGAAVLLVTHDPEEAMMMADRIAIMDQGRVLQEGTPLDLYDRPATLTVAQFFSDLNLFSGQVIDGGVATPIDRVATSDLPDGTAVNCAIRPEHLCIETMPADECNARVTRFQNLGRETLIELELQNHDQPLRSIVSGPCDLRPDAQVAIGAAAGRWMIFPDAEPVS